MVVANRVLILVAAATFLALAILAKYTLEQRNHMRNTLASHKQSIGACSLAAQEHRQAIEAIVRLVDTMSRSMDVVREILDTSTRGGAEQGPFLK
jgi:hypothetical protein